MGDKVRKLTITVLLAGSAAVLVAAPAQASREPNPTTTTQPSYVPPPKYGQNPHPVLPEEPNPYAPGTPPVVPVVLPQVTTGPGAPPADSGDQNAGDNSGRGTAPGDKVLGNDQTGSAAPSNGRGFIGGILSRTGANTLPLVRAGLAALAFGAGFLILARRRKAGAEI
jgi:hypothetical protein